MGRFEGWRAASLTVWVSALALLAAGCGGGVAEEEQLAACQTTTADGSVVVGSGAAGDPAAPEPSSGYRTGKTVVQTKSYMVVTANPLASKAGCEVLKNGGSAVDAAVAVQMVLGLVEPQSSGLGGGAFMLHYDAASKTVVSYDGRETAPAGATEDYLRWISSDTRTTPLPSARASGRSIGTPGAVRMLALAHDAHGKLPWAGLFQPGIDLATNGFKISGRMADAIAGAGANFQRDADAMAAYFNADGTPKALGTTFTLPAYADTLRAIAAGGADAFYTGPIAQDIVAEINATTGANGAALTPGATTLADLAGYQAKQRPAVCTTYRAHVVCGMGPPSSGGITVAQTLGILENFDLAQHRPTAIDIYGGKPTVLGVHLVAEANRLAYADRNKYIADTDFVALPGGSWDAMLAKPYLRSRADLISFNSSLGTAQPGNLGPVPLGTGVQPVEAGTTHMTIVDKWGNVVSMTTTVESGFGAWRMVRGFILNNQLTDFNAAPADGAGVPIANRVQPGKRPRSSMAPTLVFKQAADGSAGDLVMATGSPGGGNIIQYVAKTIIGVLDWGLDAQQATSMMNFGSSNGPTTGLGGEHPNLNTANSGNDDALVTGLRALGHTVSVVAQSSGTSTIVRTSRDNGLPAWAGGADPRREGLVLGDGY
ncbi:gamma-glutamyltransferase [Pseudaquabacterium pictum]|uniref:Glutathione hydrolase proenzyme n=1 Tax=Pseudaquabacterium pictum TaxID=2315236 RepID=A0A480AJA8_9BURK|nr:gamma-glutamyltransferase [Rubrivivax pictus]GCL61096.1 putative gamma-glutamyltranspeptidase (GgtB) [Rubrivivax pictus]